MSGRRIGGRGRKEPPPRERAGKRGTERNFPAGQRRRRGAERGSTPQPCAAPRPAGAARPPPPPLGIARPPRGRKCGAPGKSFSLYFAVFFLTLLFFYLYIFFNFFTFFFLPSFLFFFFPLCLLIPVRTRKRSAAGPTTSSATAANASPPAPAVPTGPGRWIPTGALPPAGDSRSHGEPRRKMEGIEGSVLSCFSREVMGSLAQSYGLQSARGNESFL